MKALRYVYPVVSHSYGSYGLMSIFLTFVLNANMFLTLYEF